MMLLVEHLPFTYSYMPLYTAHLAGKRAGACPPTAPVALPLVAASLPARTVPAHLAARASRRHQRGLTRATAPAVAKSGTRWGGRSGCSRDRRRVVLPGPNEVIGTNA